MLLQLQWSKKVTQVMINPAKIFLWLELCEGPQAHFAHCAPLGLPTNLNPITLFSVHVVLDNN